MPRVSPWKIAAALLAAVYLLSLAGYTIVGNAQLQPPTIFEINSKRVITVGENGVAKVHEEIKFSTEAYIAFKHAYNPISTFVRELEARTNPVQMENIKISLDDANNKLTADYTLLGAAVYKGNGVWEIKIAGPEDKIQLSSKNGNQLVFTNIHAATSDFRVIETITLHLPAKAKNPVFHEDEGTVTYTLPVKTGGSKAIAYGGAGVAVVGAALIAVSILRRRSEIPEHINIITE